MTIEELTKDIVFYIAANSQTESIFLSPAPVTSVESYGLLDHISDVSGIDKETIGVWCSEARGKEV